MAELSTAPNIDIVKDARRSTRVPESVRLSISGQSELGSSFSELTLTLAVNCHGCIYPSRNEHRTGSWVTLEFPNQQKDPRTQPVRAQVRFVRTPRNPKEHYLVGVELENPANVWRVQSTPKDWLRFPVLAGGSAGAVQTTSESRRPLGLDPIHPANGSSETMQQSPNIANIALDQGKSEKVTPTVTPSVIPTVTPAADQLLRTLEKNLQQAADRAVASAVTSQLNAAVNKAITAIDKFSQASARQLEKQCLVYQEKLIGAAREEVLRQLQAELTNAEERLQKQLESSLTGVQERIQGLAKTETSEAHLILAETVDFLKETSRDFQTQFSAQLRESMDRTAAELSAETVRFSDRQLALLSKQAQTAIGEGSALLEGKAAEARAELEAKAAEARSALETAAGTILGDFHQKASAEIEQESVNVRQNFTASLASVADGIRSDWELRERAWQDEVAQSRERHGELFRQKLETILQSSIISAVTAVNEHSKSLLGAFSKQSEVPVSEATHNS